MGLPHTQTTPDYVWCAYTAKITKFAIVSKMETPPEDELIDNFRIEKLTTMITEFENSHAIQEALYELAKGYDVKEQLESSAVMMIVLDAAHAAASAELSSILEVD